MKTSFVAPLSYVLLERSRFSVPVLRTSDGKILVQVDVSTFGCESANLILFYIVDQEDSEEKLGSLHVLDGADEMMSYTGLQ